MSTLRNKLERIYESASKAPIKDHKIADNEAEAAKEEAGNYSENETLNGETPLRDKLANDYNKKNEEIKEVANKVGEKAIEVGKQFRDNVEGASQKVGETVIKGGKAVGKTAVIIAKETPEALRNAYNNFTSYWGKRASEFNDSFKKSSEDNKSSSNITSGKIAAGAMAAAGLGLGAHYLYREYKRNKQKKERAK